MVDETIMAQLRNIIEMAKNTLFYSEIIPKDLVVDSYEKFKLIPLTEQREISKRHKDFINPKAVPWRTFVTSGTTGKPKFFHYGMDYIKYLKGRDKMLKYWGIENPENEIACVMFNMDGLASGGPVLSRALDESNIPHVTLGVAPPLSVVLDIIKEIKPTVYFVYPSSFTELTNKLKDSINLKEAGAKLIVCSGELLTDKTRKYLEEMWNAKVFSLYGCSEAGGIGFECINRDGFHLSPLFFYEILNSETGLTSLDGEGELILTPLTNPRMPLIRYNLKDIVKISYEKCSCGMTSPKLYFNKRAEEDFIIRGGIKIGADYFTHIFSFFPEITSNWQLVISEENEAELIRIFIEVHDNIANERELKEKILDEIFKNSHNLSKAITRGTLLPISVELIKFGELERKAGKIKRIIDERSK